MSLTEGKERERLIRRLSKHTSLLTLSGLEKSEEEEAVQRIISKFCIQISISALHEFWLVNSFFFN
jgi:hypothetical protein